VTSNKYPRLGTVRINTNPRSEAKCVGCSARQADLVDIEVSFLRGEDWTVRACSTCRREKGAEGLLEAAFAGEAA
jgi:hypothetical protein